MGEDEGFGDDDDDEEEEKEEEEEDEEGEESARDYDYLLSVSFSTLETAAIMPYN